MARVVFVIAQENFRDEELFHTKEELEKAGHKTMVASKVRGKIVGMLDAKARADIDLKAIKVMQYDGIVFVGGSGARAYFHDSEALELAKNFFASGKIVAAICIAPSILANAGILAGKKATAFSSEAANLKASGATFTGKPVEVDEKIVTASGPLAAREFGKKIAEIL